MGAIVLTLLMGCGEHEHSHDHEHSHEAELDTGISGLHLDGDAAAGEAIYMDSCSGCHGADGSGGVGPSLIDAIPVHSEVQIANIVTYGDGDMPAVSCHDQDLADLLAYLVETFGG